jgi:xanthine/uracil permease
VVSSFRSHPDPVSFGFEFDLGATLVMLLAFIADLGQVIGSYMIVGEAIGKQEVTSRRVNGGVLVESVGSFISSALGGLPTVTYNQNIGALIVTGMGSRYVFATAGAILIILGLCPKVGAVIASIPAPVVGGLPCHHCNAWYAVNPRPRINAPDQCKPLCCRGGHLLESGLQRCRRILCP